MALTDNKDGGPAGMSPINLIDCGLEDLVAALLHEQPITIQGGDPPFILVPPCEQPPGRCEVRFF